MKMKQWHPNWRTAVFVGLLLTGVGAGQIDAQDRPNKTDLSIRIRAVKTQLLLGEPLVLSEVIEGSVPIHADAGLTSDSSHHHLLIDRGAGFTKYRRESFSGCCVIASMHVPSPKPGDLIFVYDANLQDWAFPRPGKYRVVDEYADETVGRVRSNVVTISVVAPTGDEKAVFEQLYAREPKYTLDAHVPSGLGNTLAALVKQFPKSVYLQEPRLNDLKGRWGEFADGFDPDTREPFAEDYDTRLRLARERVAEFRQRLLPEAEALAEIESQFQPEALLTLAQLYGATGDSAAARRTYQRLVQEFPDRGAAWDARKALKKGNEDEQDDDDKDEHRDDKGEHDAGQHRDKHGQRGSDAKAPAPKPTPTPGEPKR